MTCTSLYPGYIDSTRIAADHHEFARLKTITESFRVRPARWHSPPHRPLLTQVFSGAVLKPGARVGE